MGFWSRLLNIDSTDPAQRVLPVPYEPYVATGGIPVMDPGTPLEYWLNPGRDLEAFWARQPNLRKVIGFIARQVASIPLHLYERRSDTDRLRLTSDPIAVALRTPRPRVSGYRFWESVISDGLLYDRWAIFVSGRGTGRLELHHVPSWRLKVTLNAYREVEQVSYWVGDLDQDEPWIEIPPAEVIVDFGYAPHTAGLSPVTTLRDVLDESREAVDYRRELWRNGIRAPAQVTRPANTPWDQAQRARFLSALRESFVKDGRHAGGIPLMEDGMKIEGLNIFTPEDARDIEGRQLAAVEVAAAFHIAPELVGAREGTFSNIDAFRQMLYGPSLGPYITAWEAALNAQLLPLVAADRLNLYIEANVESKLRGSFVEQAQLMQSATGAPWLTRNEARALQNRPPLAGGDELVVPLNVLVGGQASPRDSGSQNLRAAGKPRVKAAPEAGWVKQHERVLKRAFARQAAAVRTARGLKAAGDWWDGERWDRELAADLTRVGLATATAAGRAMLDSHAWDPDAYDEDRTVNWVSAVSKGAAGRINAATRDALQDGFDDDEADDSDIIDAELEDGADWRIGMLAVSSVTTMAGFGRTEAGRQTSAGFKVWIVNSGNPRPEHAALDGERVPIDEPFSNGMDWPGDPAGDVDDLAGCTCTVEVSWEAS